MATTTTADSRRRLAEAIARHQAGEGKGGSTAKKAAIVATILTAIAAVVLWLLGFFGGTPREIRELRSFVDAQVQEYDKVARNEAPLSYEFASFGPVFEKMRDLPDGMREQARDQMDRLFRARERAEMRSYFALPPAARAAELDRRIKAQEEQRKARMAEWEKRNAERNAERNSQRTAGNNRQGGQGGPGGGNRGQGGPGGGGGPPGGRGSEDGRNTRSKQRIDATSPTERSQQAEYRRAMDVRRQEMGLPVGRRP